MLVQKIVDFMEQNKYKIFKESGELNIVYVEGMNGDGSLNSDAPNQFNDLRLLISFEEDQPIALGIWEATTEPGRHYTVNPMNPNGAARIAFGQYAAWKVGTHGNSEPHESLIQVGTVKVHRDYNKDFKRTGDRIEEGCFGINQHWGYDLPYTNIGNASAGCLVGRTRNGHRDFMRSIKKDPRYKNNKNFIFTATVIPGDKL